jgi:hypothetical protein
MFLDYTYTTLFFQNLILCLSSYFASILDALCSHSDWQKHRMSVMEFEINKHMKICYLLNKGKFLIIVSYIYFSVKSCLLSIWFLNLKVVPFFFFSICQFDGNHGIISMVISFSGVNFP